MAAAKPIDAATLAELRSNIDFARKHGFLRISVPRDVAVSLLDAAAECEALRALDEACRVQRIELLRQRDEAQAEVARLQQLQIAKMNHALDAGERYSAQAGGLLDAAAEYRAANAAWDALPIEPISNEEQHRISNQTRDRLVAAEQALLAAAMEGK